MAMIADAHAPGATPLDPDEAAGLLPKHIADKGQLNQWEQANIVAASQWAFAVAARADLLSDDFARELHRRMFNQTWRWAGQYRHSDKNIGVDWVQVPTQVRDLLADARYWLEHATWPKVEAVVRLHHRMVAIHPFPDGNGRHARLLADLLMMKLSQPALTWGRGNLANAAALRATYIAALQRAGAGELGPLVDFAQS
jgi:Fic-DOC domain mobile mystery protein B